MMSSLKTMDNHQQPHSIAIFPPYLTVKNNNNKYSFGAQEICTFEQWTQLPNQPGVFRVFIMIAILAMLVILVVGGNALVIAAVVLRRRLRSATGLLILSLAVADLLVGLFVLPFSLANEVLSGFWVFGDTWCTAWLTIDIWMCTSSVYNLVAISVDRYIAIIKPLNYPMIITKFRARLIVAAVWISSFIVCSPSFLLASSKRKNYIEEQMARNGTTSAQQFVLQNPNACRCTPSNSGMYYILFSASSSFYIPYCIVIFVYVRIYIAAMAATKSAYAGMVQVAENANKNPIIRTETKETAKRSASTLKLPRLFASRSQLKERQQLEMHRFSVNPPKSIPISINSSSMPTVYAQINGSSGNLNHLKNLRDFERRRSEDKSLIKDRAEMNSIQVRRSIPSEVVYESQERLTPQKDTNGDVSDESNGSVDEMKSMLGPNATVNNTRSEGIDNGSTRGDNDPPSTNGTTKKKKNAVSTILSRILGNAKRKKAAGTYEKRLSLEIKAAKTVAIVTGCFIFCWLGFSIYYGLTAFDVYVNEVVWSIFFWLGYLNSAFNPVIYTVFNREFRMCFKQLLTCNNMIFAGRNANHQIPMCNSFNSQLRLGNEAMIRRQQGEQSEDA